MLLKDSQPGSGDEVHTVNHTNPKEGRKLLQEIKCFGKLMGGSLEVEMSWRWMLSDLDEW